MTYYEFFTTPERVADEVIIERLVRLTRWLARSYNDNDPVFSFTSLKGFELATNVELARTWYDVVRGGEYPDVLKELLAAREGTPTATTNDANDASLMKESNND